jgi:hypothetical protein
VRKLKLQENIAVGRLTTDIVDKTFVSLGLLGAAAFMVVADARVIGPLLHIIADEFKVGVGSATLIISAFSYLVLPHLPLLDFYGVGRAIWAILNVPRLCR